MTAVLVSGGQPLLDAVGDALTRRGVSVTDVDDLQRLPHVADEAGAGSFDAYVQLPAAFAVYGATAIERVHHFYAAGVLARFPALGAVLPCLTARGRVVFVLGQLPPEAASDDDRAARRSLTRVLAQAARADAQDGSVQVTWLDSSAAADEIAAAAIGAPTTSTEPAQMSDRRYADWRTEMLGLVSVET
jgi:hypothetical protein